MESIATALHFTQPLLCHLQLHGKRGRIFSKCLLVVFPSYAAGVCPQTREVWVKRLQSKACKAMREPPPPTPLPIKSHPCSREDFLLLEWDSQAWLNFFSGITFEFAIEKKKASNKKKTKILRRTLSKSVVSAFSRLPSRSSVWFYHLCVVVSPAPPPPPPPMSVLTCVPLLSGINCPHLLLSAFGCWFLPLVPHLCLCQSPGLFWFCFSHLVSMCGLPPCWIVAYCKCRWQSCMDKKKILYEKSILSHKQIAACSSSCSLWTSS